MPVQGAMNNQLLFQLLMGAGQDIGQGNPLGANVAAVFNQNLAAQNYANMLQQMLGNNSKITMDAQNFSIKGPMQALQGNNPMGSAPGLKSLPIQGESGSVGVMDSGANIAPSIAGAIMKSNIGGSVVNPSSSPLGNLTASDLAGLTPQDMASALQFRNADRQFQRQSVNDVIDNMYKMGLIKQGQMSNVTSRMREMRQLHESMKEAPYKVFGRRVDFETWKSLPTDTKAYAAYYFDAEQRGDEDIKTYDEFVGDTDPGVLVKYYEYGLKDPEFKKWLEEDRARSKTEINIQTATEKAGALADVKSEKYFTDPKGGLSTDVQEYIESEPVQIQLDEYLDDPVKMRNMTYQLKDDFIKGKIIAAGGKINKEYLDGRTFVYVVTWPSGKTQEVRSAN